MVAVVVVVVVVLVAVVVVVVVVVVAVTGKIIGNHDLAVKLNLVNPVVIIN